MQLVAPIKARVIHALLQPYHGCIVRSPHKLTRPCWSSRWCKGKRALLVRYGHCHEVSPHGADNDRIYRSTELIIHLKSSLQGILTAAPACRPGPTVKPFLPCHVEKVIGAVGASEGDCVCIRSTGRGPSHSPPRACSPVRTRVRAARTSHVDIIVTS